MPTSNGRLLFLFVPVVSKSSQSSASGFPFQSLSCFLMILPSKCFAIR